MFNVDGKEFVFLVLIALVVLGPEKLPDLFRRAGKAYSEFRRLSDGFQEEFRRAVEEPVTEMKVTGTLIRESVDLRTTVTSDPGDDQPEDGTLEDHQVDDLIDDLPVADMEWADDQSGSSDRTPGDDRPERTEDDSGATVDAGANVDAVANATEEIDPRVHQVELPSFSGESGVEDDRHASESGSATEATEPIQPIQTVETIETVETVDFEFVESVSAEDPTAADPTAADPTAAGPADRGRVNGDGGGRRASDRDSTERASVDARVTDEIPQNGASDDLDRRA